MIAKIKKIYLLPIVCILCISLLFTGCKSNPDPEGTSDAVSEEVSEPNEPSVAYYGELENALKTYDNFFTKISDASALVFPQMQETGNVTGSFRMEAIKVSVGQTALDLFPSVLIDYDGIKDKKDSKYLLQLKNEDETVPFEITQVADGRYVDYVGITEQPLYSPGATAIALPDTLTRTDLTALLIKLSKAYREAFLSVLDPDTEITMKQADGCDVFTVKLNETQLDALNEKIEDVMASSSLGGGMLFFPEYDVAPMGVEGAKSAVYTLIVKGDAPASLNSVQYVGSTVVEDSTLYTSAFGDTYQITQTVKSGSDESTPLDLRFTAKKGSLRMTMTALQLGNSISATVTFKQDGDSKITYTGTVTLPLGLFPVDLPLEGLATLPLPLEFSGSRSASGETSDSEFVLNAQSSSLLPLHMFLQQSVTKADVTVTAPEKYILQSDADTKEIERKFAELYPKTNETYALLLEMLGMGAGDEDVTIYETSDQTVAASLSEDVFGINAAVRYADTDGVYSLYYYNLQLAYRVPYTKSGTDSYTLFGQEAEAILFGDELSALSVAFEGGEFTLYFDSDAFLTASLVAPYTENNGVITPILPDWLTFPVNVSYTEDEMTVGSLKLEKL